MNTRRFLVPLAAVSLVLGAAPFAGASAPRLARPSLPSVLPSWLHSGTRVGALDPNTTINFVIMLKGQDDAGLAALSKAVSTPGNPAFGHFLNHAQYLNDFAPSPASIAKAVAWLTTAGITVDHLTPGGRVIAVHATAAQITHRLGVNFARYDHQGVVLRAALSEVRLPASIAPLVAAVSGLTSNPMHNDHVVDGAAPATNPTPSPIGTAGLAYLNGRPCSASFDSTIASKLPSFAGKHRGFAVCGYTPTQVRAAYGVDKTKLTGKGVTVAVIDAYASSTMAADANEYSRRHGLKPLVAGQYTESDIPVSVETPVTDPQGWAGEQTLDVEAVHAMAPDALIHYYGAISPENATLNVALAEAIETGAASEITNSYGSQSDGPTPDYQTVFDTLMTEAAANGMGVEFSSGDSADEVVAGGGRTADYPATSPAVTAVGGTTLEVNSHNQYVGETYWGTHIGQLSPDKKSWLAPIFSAGGGGGRSGTYPEPAYQTGYPVPTQLATHIIQDDTLTGAVPAGRVVPDIAMIADSTTGFLVGESQTQHSGNVAYSEYRIGGTSVSSPMWAGFLANVVQARGAKLGFINPAMYQLAKSAKKALFRDPSLGRKVAEVRTDYLNSNDATSGLKYTLRSLGNLGTLSDLKGYDDSTGLGSPYLPSFVAAFAPRP